MVSKRTAASPARVQLGGTATAWHEHVGDQENKEWGEDKSSLLDLICIGSAWSLGTVCGVWSGANYDI